MRISPGKGGLVSCIMEALDSLLEIPFRIRGAGVLQDRGIRYAQQV